MPTKIQDTRLRGAAVELAKKLILDDAPESEFNVIAYEVALRGRGDVKLTRQDFESVVRNFERYPRVPVVLQHADTDPAGHPDSAKARGWITALRVGQMERGGKQAATLEAKFTLDEATRADVNKDPPAWAYCSITIIKNARDEESGQAVGAVLYSLSLTNNPALQGLDRIAAADERGIAATQEEKTMNGWLKLAAKLGIAASTEEEAETKILAHAEQLGDIRRALGLGASASPIEVIAKLTEALTEAAKVPGLTKQIEAFEKREDDRLATDRKEHIDALIEARPELADVRASLEVHAETDWKGFVAKHPRPSVAEQHERAQDEQRLERITGTGHRALPDPRGTHDARDIRAAAYNVIAEARKQSIELSFADAVDIVLGNSEDESLDLGDIDPELEGVR